MKRNKTEFQDVEPSAKSSRSTQAVARAHRDVASAPSTPPPSNVKRPGSEGSHNSLSRKIAALTVKNHNQRKENYKGAMTKLNKQFYLLAKRALEGHIADDGTYTHLTAIYIQQAAYLKRLYCKTYGDVAIFGDGDCGQLGCGPAVSAARSPRVVAGLRGLEVGAVACGGLHTLVLTDNGEVYSFGCNDEGALGGEMVQDGYLPCKVGEFVPSASGPNGGPSPTAMTFEQRKKLVGEATIVQLAAGETTSLALSEDGDVYMWGSYRDSEGRKFRHLPPPDDDRTSTGRKDIKQLEDDEREEWYHPPRGNQDWPVHVCLEKKARDISAGEGWAAALLEDESLVTWGIGTHGEMGRKVPKLDKKTPNKVIIDEFLTPKPPVWSGPLGRKRVSAVSCGAYHLLAVVREAGMNVYSCGLNQYGQLGLGNEETKYELTKVRILCFLCYLCLYYYYRLEFLLMGLLVSQIDSLEDRNIVKVEAGFHFSCFVNSTGKELYACGRSDYGQLGISIEQPDSGSFETTPVRVPLVYTVQQHKVTDPKGNCIVESDIAEEDQPEIEQISCGSTHVLVLTKAGDVYSWGFGESGACGHGKCDDDVLRPKKLETKLANAQGAKYEVKFVSGGGQHSAIVVATGSR
jgi:regulator of chromosome condensation